MIYYIEVQDTHARDFIQIIQSLKNLGVIESHKSSGNLAKEGEPLTTEALLNVLENARQEVSEGKVVSSEDVKNRVASWTKN